jgi:hypothetical protein
MELIEWKIEDKKLTPIRAPGKDQWGGPRKRFPAVELRENSYCLEIFPVAGNIYSYNMLKFNDLLRGTDFVSEVLV